MLQCNKLFFVFRLGGTSVELREEYAAMLYYLAVDVYSCHCPVVNLHLFSLACACDDEMSAILNAFIL